MGKAAAASRSTRLAGPAPQGWHTQSGLSARMALLSTPTRTQTVAWRRGKPASTLMTSINLFYVAGKGKTQEVRVRISPRVIQPNFQPCHRITSHLLPYRLQLPQPFSMVTHPNPRNSFIGVTVVGSNSLLPVLGTGSIQIMSSPLHRLLQPLMSASVCVRPTVF